MKTITTTLKGAAATLALTFAAGGAIAQDCPSDLPTVTPGVLTMSINATIPGKSLPDRARRHGLPSVYSDP